MATTARGHIEQLPSGSFWVHGYAGTDPVTGKPRRLKQTCPDEASAAAALGKLLAQADGDHFPNREATLGQYQQHMPPSGADELALFASLITRQAGLDEHTTLAWLTEFALGSNQRPSRCERVV
jgi:hypothetical protein